MNEVQTAANPLGTDRIGRLLRSFAIPGIISMVINSLYNMVDQIFIGQGVGMLGNGATNIIAPISTIAIALACLFKFKNIKLTRESFRFRFSFAGMLASLGIASCLNTMTSTIIGMVSNNMLTHYGALSVYGEDIPITVFGLCMKVSMLFFSIAMGISSASRPILGFNYGAEKYERVKKTLYLALGSTTAVMTAAWLIYQLFPLQLIRIFGTESALYEEFAVKCFRIYLLTNFLGGVQLCAGTLFQAIGHPAKATVGRRREPVRYVVERVYAGTESRERLLTSVSEEAARRNVEEKLKNGRKE